MNDKSELSEDPSMLTWDDYTRILILSRSTLPMLIVTIAILINITLIQLQGGIDRIRDDIREHTVEAEKLRQKQEWDRKTQEWTHGWDEHRRNSDDDNYAK